MNIYATKSVTLLPGFKAEHGSTFKTGICTVSNGISCLPNPTKSMTLKSLKVEQDTVVQSNRIDTKDKIVNSKIIIFPNPNKGNFTLNISDQLNPNATIEIFNSTGQILYKEVIRSNNQNIIFTNISGTYIVKVTNGLSIFTEKIILEK